MKRTRRTPLALRILHRALCAVGAIVFTGSLMLVLPVIQAIASTTKADTMIRSVDTASLPPPPLMEEQIEEEAEEEEPPPPELAQESAPLDLSQLELALNPSFGSGGGAGSFDFALDGLIGAKEAVDQMFSGAAADQKPRVLYQAQPTLSGALRRQASGGSVSFAFTVDRNGKVKDAQVTTSSDPVLEKPARDALAKWKFEPAKRKGQPVEHRMKVTIRFP